MTELKLLVRAAVRIQRVYQQQSTRPASELATQLDSLEDDVAALRESDRKLTFVRSRGWRVAAAEYAREVLARIDGLQNLAHQLRSLASVQRPEPPTLGLLVQDLRQLAEEFTDFSIDFKQRRVTVTTEPIELEGVYLGPFALQIRWNELAQGSFRCSLAVVALDPHPAATNEGVTHPHVKDEVLCAGDATVPLERALCEGRLADACLLVRSVLTTYNDGSPHVSLKEWYGGTCVECGTGLDSDDGCYCEGCSGDCCDDCFRLCDNCEIGRCVACLGSCLQCEKRICGACQRFVLKQGVYCEACHHSLNSSDAPPDQVEPEPAIATA